VVEDEKKTGSYLRKGLTESGFIVDVAEEGDDGLHLAQTGDYDLVVLDVMLPGRDGWSVLKELRRCGKQVPVLFLTARDTVEDRVKGLKAGADDYLAKPFAFAELLARVRTLLRRGSSRQPDTLRVGDLEIDFVRHRALRAGKRLDLTPKDFSLLSLLARRKGEVLTRTVIAGSHSFPLSARPPEFGRNSFKTPALANIDFRVLKYFPFGKTARLDLVVEAFNLLNRVNVAQINPIFGAGATPLPGFRQPITGTGARRIQFSLDFEF